MISKKEFLDRLENARSWKETGLSVEDVYNAFSTDLSNNDDRPSKEMQKELEELRGKVMRLTETNRQLRAENKQLRSGK